ncbi:MAG: hypothetical protein H6558_10450 [Lewinellaceae bacterium]|nr:hypothetical protein [Lewinellaceae bacterium]
MKKYFSQYHWKIFFSLLLLPSLTNCDKWRLEKESFPKVITLDYEVGRNATEALLFGEIVGMVENDLVEECGHVWGLTPDSLFLGNTNGHRRLGKRGNGRFQTDISGLTPGKTYFYRAYIRNKYKTTLYGEIWDLSTPSFSPVFSLDSITRQMGELRVNIYTTISNLSESVGLPITSYGIIWSDNPLPNVFYDPFVPQQEILITEDSISYLSEVTLPGGKIFLRPYLLIGDNAYYGNSVPYTIDNVWIQKADFEGEARYSAVGFSIGQKCYLGTGISGNGEKILKDFWEYDPLSDIWTKKADFGGGPRYYAVGFSIDQKGYIGTGLGENSEFKKDFWEYDPVSDSWTPLADFEGGERTSAIGFSIGNKGYLGTGWGAGGFLNDFWEYCPETDIWVKKTNLGGTERGDAVGFSINLKGYITTGGIIPAFQQPYKDFWEYIPD